MNKKFQDLTIKDAFMFAAVMSDEQICAEFLSLVLNMKILEVRIMTEKTLAYHSEYHGVRLDVLAIEKGTERRFDVEMQVKVDGSLPKRSRYYHACMDMDALDKSKSYKMLPDSYVIFICDYDPVGDERYVHTYKSTCMETGEPFEDGSKTVLLSTKGKNREQIPDSLAVLLDYFGHPEKENIVTDEPFLYHLADKVAAIKKERIWEESFVLLEEMIDNAKAEGEKIGRAEGKIEGQERVFRLFEILAERGRADDVIKAVNNVNLQEQLFREFDL